MESHSEIFLSIKDKVSKINKVWISNVGWSNNIEIFVFTCHGVHGEIHSTPDGFVDFSMYPFDQEISSQVEEIVSTVLDEKPCVSFKEKVVDSDNVILHCKEWYQDDSDAHVLRMMEGLNEGEIKNTSDFRILTGKSKEYYERRLNKIPGLYEGNLSPEESEFALSCSEFNLYYLIAKKVLEFRALVPTEVKLADLTEEQEETRFALEYLCVQTKRFGVDIEPAFDYSTVKLGMEYALWLNSWNMFLANLPFDIREYYERKAASLIDVYPMFCTVNSNMYEDGIKHIYFHPMFLQD